MKYDEILEANFMEGLIATAVDRFEGPFEVTEAFASNVTFHKQARKEFDKLNKSAQANFEKKINERAKSPRHEADRVTALRGAYKLKLEKLRLVYRVEGDDTMFILAVGVRNHNEAYEDARSRS